MVLTAGVGLELRGRVNSREDIAILSVKTVRLGNSFNPRAGKTLSR
jgi:hypothetical protein